MEAESVDLLILACSQRKRCDNGLIPAIERYDGPLYRVLRKFFRSVAPRKRLVETYILSAQFGLIAGYTPIPYYDRRMTPERSAQLAPVALCELENLFQTKGYQELYLGLGRDYFNCLPGYENLLPAETRIVVAEGAIGQRQSHLKQWLERRWN